MLLGGYRLLPFGILLLHRGALVLLVRQVMMCLGKIKAIVCLFDLEHRPDFSHLRKIRLSGVGKSARARRSNCR
jgi:hypothetical protein